MEVEYVYHKESLLNKTIKIRKKIRNSLIFIKKEKKKTFSYIFLFQCKQNFLLIIKNFISIQTDFKLLLMMLMINTY